MKNYRLFLLALGIALLVWTIWIGYTWHLVPVYLALFIIAIAVVKADKIKRRVLLASGILVLPALSLFFLYFFPFVAMPKPTGKYAVGVTYKKIETKRDEIFTEEEGDTRTLYVKIWYPAQQGVNHNPYVEEAEKALAMLLPPDLPAFPFEQLTKIKTNSYTNAAVADGRFPLLTFSHGLGFWFGQNTALMEELASQGYIVASIGHSHQTAFAAANENTLVTFPQIVLPFEPKTDEKVDTAYQNLERRIYFEKSETDQRVFDKFFSELILNSRVSNEHTVIWANDITSTIDFMFRESESAGSHFHDRIDTRKIGTVGFSFGGAAAAEAALKDRRILGAINMDGGQFGTWINDTIKTPVLFLESDKSAVNLSMYGPFFGRTKSDIHCLLFKNASHANFSDINFYSPAFKWLGGLGEVDAEFMIRSMNVIIPDYFNSIFSNNKFQVEKHVMPGVVEEPVY